MTKSRKVAATSADPWGDLATKAGISNLEEHLTTGRNKVSAALTHLQAIYADGQGDSAVSYTQKLHWALLDLLGMHEALLDVLMRAHDVQQGQVAETGLKTAPLPYRGTWHEGQYQPGNFVTHKGSLWHCDKETTGKPGDDFDAWTLTVKSGQGGAQLVQKLVKTIKTFRDDQGNLIAEIVEQMPTDGKDARS